MLETHALKTIQMTLYCDGQVRLSREKLAKIRKDAAENGHVVQDVKTPLEYLEATLKMMDEETLTQVEDIVAKFMKKHNITI